MKPLLNSLLFAPTDRTLVQFFRYGFVAAVAMVFDFSTFAFLATVVEVYPVIASTAGFTIGITLMYLMSTRWVFSNRQHTKRVEMTGFFIIGLVGMGLTNTIVWLIAVVMDQNPLLAKAVAVVIVFFWNFGARKWLLFK